MDNNTREELLKVGNSLPKEIKDKLLVEEKRDTEHEELVHRSIENAKKIENPKMREEVIKQLEDSLTPPSMVSNARAEKKAEEYITAKVKKLIADKKIPPAKVDSWMRSKGLRQK